MCTGLLCSRKLKRFLVSLNFWKQICKQIDSQIPEKTKTRAIFEFLKETDERTYTTATKPQSACFSKPRSWILTPEITEIHIWSKFRVETIRLFTWDFYEKVKLVRFQKSEDSFKLPMSQPIWSVSYVYSWTSASHHY